MILRIAARMDGIDRTLIRRIFESAPPGAINLGLGQPDLPSPPSILLAGIAAAAAGRTGYSPTGGDPELRAAVAARMAPFVAGPEGVLVTVGSQEAMYAACLALLDPGDEILYPDPGYPAYPVVARLTGAVGVPYRLEAADGWRLDPDRVAAGITPRTRLAIVCSPSNPTGAIHDPGDLARLAELLAGRGVAWLSDEIYAGFSYDGPCPSLSAIAAPGSGLVLSGLSKDVSMTGWRVGWVAGDPAIVARLTAAHQYLVTSAPSISQRAALGAFTPAGEAERVALLERFRRRRELMEEGLHAVPGIRYHRPAGAFYFFVDVSAHGSSLEVARRVLERRNVITIPGEAFGPGGAGYLRLSYAASEEAIRAGTAALAAELGERVSGIE